MAARLDDEKRAATAEGGRSFSRQRVRMHHAEMVFGGVDCVDRLRVGASR